MQTLPESNEVVNISRLSSKDECPPQTASDMTDAIVADTPPLSLNCSLTDDQQRALRGNRPTDYCTSILAARYIRRLPHRH